VLANIAIIAAGLVTAFLWRSAWPDLIVGLGIVAMNADAAQEVWTVAREEHAAAKGLRLGDVLNSVPAKKGGRRT
jgi:Co/Zn/Cd efflux system component